MRERIKRLLGRGPEFTIDPATRAPTGRLRLDEAVTLGLAAVGRHSYGTWMSPAIHVVASEGPRPNIQIGGFCSIAPGVQFLAGGRHHSEWITTFPLRIAFGIPGAGEDGHPLPPRPIIVGNDVAIIAYAGLRPGEALALKRSNVGQKTIHVVASMKLDGWGRQRPDHRGWFRSCRSLPPIWT